MKSKRLDELHKEMVKESKNDLRERRIAENPATADAKRRLMTAADRTKEEGING